MQQRNAWKEAEQGADINSADTGTMHVHTHIQVHYLTALFSPSPSPSTEPPPPTPPRTAAASAVLRALEADPRLLVHGFGRISRAGFVVEVRAFLCF